MTIVTVDTTHLQGPPLRVRVAIVLDKTPRQIADLRRRRGNRDLFILPFFTGTIDGIPSFRRVKSEFIVKPYYVGNLSPMSLAIRQIKRQVLDSFRQVPGIEVDIAMDETKGITQ